MEGDILMTIDFEGISGQSIQVIPSNIAWEDLELMLKVFSDREHINVYYADEDLDQVIIKSHEELQEAFKVAKKFNNALNVKVQQAEADQSKATTESETIVTDLKNLSVTMSKEPRACTNPEKAVTASTPDEACNKVVDHKTNKCEPEVFWLRNQAWKLVLDVRGGSREPGTSVIAWPRKQTNALNQLWYQCLETGTLRSALNDFCLDLDDKKRPCVQPHAANRASQLWQVTEGLIHNRQDAKLSLVIVAGSGRRNAGAQLIASRYQAMPHCHWEKVLREKSANEQETGEKGDESEAERSRKSAGSDVYATAAEYMKQLSIKCEESGESGSTSADKKNTSSPDDQVPAWFGKAYDTYKRDLSSDISRQVVQQVLRGLEGAVVTSLYGSGSPAGKTVPQALTPEPADAGASQDTVRYAHPGVVCDNCEQYIVGVRYKCGNCEDFDLCEQCEPLHGIHPSDHVFLKIRRPTLTAGRRRNGKMFPLLKRSLYVMEEEQQAREMVKLKEEKLRRKCEKLEQKIEQTEQLQQQPGEEVEGEKVERLKRKEEKLKRRLDQMKDKPNKKERLDLPQFRLPVRMSGEFLGDETIPDGTHVQPGTKLTKAWLLKNTGTHPWDSNTKLKMMWGDMSPVKPEVGVPLLKPQEQGVVAVEIIAPATPGKFQSHWRLCYQGARFGHRVWCCVVVDPKEVLEPAEKKDQPMGFCTLGSLQKYETVDDALATPDAKPTVTVATTQAMPDVAIATTQVETIVAVATTQTRSDVCLAQTQAEPSVAMAMIQTEPMISVASTQSERNVSFSMAQTDDEVTASAETQTYKSSTEHKSISTILTQEDKSTATSRASSQDKGITTNSIAAHDKAVTANVLTQQDIMAFELLDIGERHTPKVSQTATPNNTPLDISPPKSPMPEADFGVRALSNSSSVEIVSDISPECDPDSITLMSQLVQERMANLGLRPDLLDIESLSSLSDDDGSDTDSDFYIVPVPDFFNPDLPLSRSTSTTVCIKKDAVQDNTESTEDLIVRDDDDGCDFQHYQATASETQPLLASSDDCTTAAETQPLLNMSDDERFADADEDEPSSSRLARTPLEDDSDGSEEMHDAPETTDVNDNVEISGDIVDAVPASPSETSPKQRMQRDDRETSPSAGSVFTAALGVAHQAAAQAYHTAKDVFHTLQAKNEGQEGATYFPQQKDWTPPESDWKPPFDEWTPAETDWSPPQNTWTAPENTWSPPAHTYPTQQRQSTPMDRLVEMGFAQRDVNQQLLDRNEGDLEKVIAELVSGSYNNWPTDRH